MSTRRAVRIELPRPTWRRGLTELRARPGRIDDDVREVFGWGYCHMLAMAVHEVTGWQLAVIERQKADRGWRWAHAGVIAPRSGLFTDIHGEREISEVISALDAAGHNGPYRLSVMDSFAEFGDLIGLEAGSETGWWRSRLNEAGQSVTEGFARQVATAAGWTPDRQPEAGG